MMCNILHLVGNFKELQLKGNLFDLPQSWTLARLTYSDNNKKTPVSQIFNSENLFIDSHFHTITPGLVSCLFVTSVVTQKDTLIPSSIQAV